MYIPVGFFFPIQPQRQFKSENKNVVSLHSCSEQGGKMICMCRSREWISSDVYKWPRCPCNVDNCAAQILHSNPTSIGVLTLSLRHPEEIKGSSSVLFSLIHLHSTGDFYQPRVLNLISLFLPILLLSLYIQQEVYGPSGRVVVHCTVFKQM